MEDIINQHFQNTKDSEVKGVLSERSSEEFLKLGGQNLQFYQVVQNFSMYRKMYSITSSTITKNSRVQILVVKRDLDDHR